MRGERDMDMGREKNLKLEVVKEKIGVAVQRAPHNPWVPFGKLLIKECGVLTKDGMGQLPWDLLALHIGQVILRGCGLKQPPLVNGVVQAPTPVPTDVPPQA